MSEAKNVWKSRFPPSAVQTFCWGDNYYNPIRLGEATDKRNWYLFNDIYLKFFPKCYGQTSGIHMCDTIFLNVPVLWCSAGLILIAPPWLLVFHINSLKKIQTSLVFNYSLFMCWKWTRNILLWTLDLN